MIPALQHFSFLTVLLRLVLAVVCGSILGYGRSKQERSAGLRTYILICVGSTLSVLITIYDYAMLQGPWAAVVEEVGTKFDASRLAAQVIAGIGFLGAGTIIKVAHQQVKGLTTATGLFATVCMGMAIGAGYYLLALVSCILIEVILNGISPWEISFKRHLRNITLSVTFSSLDDLATITGAMEGEHAVIYDIDVEQADETEDRHPSAIFILQMTPGHSSHSGMLTSIAELPCVLTVEELIA